jgi:tocopherol cyclase
MFKQMTNPDLYHGRLPWNKFEGWYFKLCSEAAAFAFIPGIFHGDSNMRPHSFLQVLDGPSVAYDYIIFPAESFRASAKKLELAVGENSFSLSGIRLDTGNSSFGSLKASLRLDNVRKWDCGGKAHRSMGFYNFLPFMECYSQVCAMDMEVSGYVSIGGRTYEFENGRGYVEKNWGKQFPLSWLWVQCNCFEHTKASLSASVGHIPFILGSFRGFLIGLQTEMGFYGFTSMNGSKLEVRQAGRDRAITAESGRYRLDIITGTSEDAFVLCNAPKDGQMIPLVRETLTAAVHIKLAEIHTGRVLLEDTGRNTGIEYGGEQSYWGRFSTN